MSFNKFYQQQNDKDDIFDSTDRGREGRHNIECYVNETALYSPSSPVSFSPDYDYERATQNQKSSSDNADEIAATLDWRHHNRLLSACSPTSSQSTNSEVLFENDLSSREKNIGRHNEHDSHRLSASCLNEPSFSTFPNDSKKEKQEFHHFAMQPTNVFPRRAPGFPKVCRASVKS